MKYVTVWIFAFVILMSGLANASIDSIGYPYDGENLTSPTINTNFTYTNSTTCYWSYNNVHNYTIACGGDKIRLPRIDGSYLITISDDLGSTQSVTVSLEYPNGFVIIFFSSLFIFFVAGLLALLIYTIFQFIAMDFDARDLIINVSAYFAVFATYILIVEYLGNPFMEDFLLLLLHIGSVTTVLIPFVAFLVSYIKLMLDKNKPDHN